MAKTYAIRTLDAQGDVILSTRGRVGALTKAMDALQDYRDACTKGSGHLFTFAADRQDRVVIGDYTVEQYDEAETVIRSLDLAA